MKEQMIDEKTLQAVMSVITSAGDVRVLCKEALNATADRDFELVNEKMREAGKRTAEAHRAQTDATQGETRGEKQEYTLPFVHAQDMLMIIYSKTNLAKQIFKIFESWEERLQVPEQR